MPSNNKRYPGPKPFTASQAHLFHGRESEAKRLTRLMSEQQLTVLYGRSGYGKSSLLNAAVLPSFQAEGYHVINVRLGAWTPESTNTPLRGTVHALAENPDDMRSTVLDELVQWDNSLWYYTKTFAINTQRPRLLFVFDQFEELFTYPLKEVERYEAGLAELLKTNLPQRYRDQLTQKTELANHPQRPAVFERLDIKVVIAIRSNRFHLLERLTPTLPQILQNTLELDALTREGARTAIVEPARDIALAYECQPFTYTTQAQDEILDFLTQEDKIEGILLQMLCAHFERMVLQDPSRTSIDLVDIRIPGAGGQATTDGDPLEAIVDYYYRARIDDLPDEQEETVKRFIEDNLVQQVGSGGMRLSMHQAQIKDRFGIEADILNTLVQNGLLRTEPFLRGGVTYELTHDRLITPVLKSRAIYEAGQADRLQAELEEEARKRKEAEALREKAEVAQKEAEAERTRAQQAEGQAHYARQVAEEQRQEAEHAKVAAQRNEKRATRLAWIAAATLVVALGLGAFAWYSLLTVKSERAEKNLIVCKEFLVDARRLAKANYCSSATEKIGRAAQLIDDFGTLGNTATCAAYNREAATLETIKAIVTNKEKQGACR
ncbi:MAG: hypothetical protein DA408_04905 [Bacteroidetes bacterium]|nr:MAG: hypothetical protein C7N36_03880 [Bacteroidota bacterium]PTM13940.1 MAG: hypothetical protein DA408_04905 [Bacteroidota bacterium]